MLWASVDAGSTSTAAITASQPRVKIFRIELVTTPCNVEMIRICIVAQHRYPLLEVRSYFIARYGCERPKIKTVRRGLFWQTSVRPPITGCSKKFPLVVKGRPIACQPPQPSLASQIWALQKSNKMLKQAKASLKRRLCAHYVVSRSLRRCRTADGSAPSFDSDWKGATEARWSKDKASCSPDPHRASDSQHAEFKGNEPKKLERILPA
jgi:hypothetical protein